LIQSAPGVDVDEPAVRLTVTGSDRPPLARSAPDFLTLRRQYPAETTKYLEPIFRELHADGIAFSPDSKVAWQVFASEARADPSVTGKVSKIIQRLDSDDFHERESAAADLKQLGQPAAVVLWHTNRSALSAEQNSRIDAFLSEYQPVTDQDVKRLRTDVTFLLECLYDTDDFLVDTALAHLRQITGKPIDFDRTLRDEARREAVNQLRETLAPAATQPVEPG
jgi:hypothetical protein